MNAGGKAGSRRLGTLPPSGIEQGGIASEAGQARSILCGVVVHRRVGLCVVFGRQQHLWRSDPGLCQRGRRHPAGMDLRGGVEVVFGPPEGVDATEAELRLAQAILERRLLSQDITDGEVYTDFDQARILVRYPADVMEGMEEDLSSTVAGIGGDRPADLAGGFAAG